MIIEYSLEQEFDLRGCLEEFTNDAYLTLPSASTGHLDEDGLPSVGRDVFPGMLLIGRFGTTASYREGGLPNDLERWSEDEESLIKRHGHMFYDRSFYVPAGVYGKVKEAYLEEIEGGRKRAVVRIDVPEISKTDRK